MKSHQALINQLVKDLPNDSESKNWDKKFWIVWFFFFFLTAVLTYASSLLFPQDIYLPHDLKNAQFWTEITIWLLLSLASLRLTYLSALPGANTTDTRNFCISMAALISVAILFHTSFTSLYLDFLTELNMSQGPCGIFILTIGAIWTFALASMVRKAAPTNLSLTAVSLTLSTGAATTMFMHLFCRHESSSHIIMWHLIPLILLVFITHNISPKIMRW